MKKRVVDSWETTLLGVAFILGGIALKHYKLIDETILASFISVGLICVGIKQKDKNVEQ